MLSVIIVSILFGLVALALAALLTPIRLQASVRTNPRLDFTFEARPLGGLSPPIRLSSRSAHAKKPKPKGPKKRKSGRSRLTLDRKRLLLELPHLLVELFGAFRFHLLHVDADFGLNDPADTGRVFGVLAPLQYASSALPGVSVSLRPNFTGSSVSGEASLVCRFYLALLIAPVIRFAWRVLRWPR